MNIIEKYFKFFSMKHHARRAFALKDELKRGSLNLQLPDGIRCGEKFVPLNNGTKFCIHILEKQLSLPKGLRVVTYEDVVFRWSEETGRKLKANESYKMEMEGDELVARTSTEIVEGMVTECSLVVQDDLTPILEAMWMSTPFLTQGRYMYEFIRVAGMRMLTPDPGSKMEFCGLLAAQVFILTKNAILSAIVYSWEMTAGLNYDKRTIPTYLAQAKSRMYMERRGHKKMVQDKNPGKQVGDVTPQKTDHPGRMKDLQILENRLKMEGDVENLLLRDLEEWNRENS